MHAVLFSVHVFVQGLNEAKIIKSKKNSVFGTRKEKRYNLIRLLLNILQWSYWHKIMVQCLNKAIILKDKENSTLGKKKSKTKILQGY